MPDESIDLIITDPPYGVGFSRGFDDSKEHVSRNIYNWLSSMWRVLKEGSHIYIFVPMLEIGMWVEASSNYFELKNILSGRAYTSQTYLKNNFQFNNQLILFLHKGKGKPFNNYDLFETSEAWFNDKRNKNPKKYTYSYPAYLPNKLFINTKSNGLEPRHPAEKNPELLKLFVAISSSEGDVVLDPFMGGCSTGIACKELNRSFIGFELNKDYFELAVSRVGDKS